MSTNLYYRRRDVNDTKLCKTLKKALEEHCGYGNVKDTLDQNDIGFLEGVKACLWEKPDKEEIESLIATIIEDGWVHIEIRG